MKLFTLLVLAVSFILVGCEKKDDNATKPATPPTNAPAK